MKGNDLSNLVVPRDVLVWEGLFGLILDPKIRAMEQKYCDKGQWKYAVSCYEINELLARKVWDLTWRFNIEIDLLTYRGREFAVALAERMDNENLPFRRVWSEDPHVLARNLAITPDIRTIYHPDTDRQFLYGGKGRVLTPDTAHLYLGAM